MKIKPLKFFEKDCLYLGYCFEKQEKRYVKLSPIMLMIFSKSLKGKRDWLCCLLELNFTFEFSKTLCLVPCSTKQIMVSMSVYPFLGKFPLRPGEGKYKILMKLCHFRKKFAIF